MKSVLGAVSALNATGMAHRHIKPDNTMMTSNLDQGGYVLRRVNDGKKSIAILESAIGFHKASVILQSLIP